jgi:ATP-dependent protease HslVU (ClpYQ) peptidase subunit
MTVICALHLPGQGTWIGSDRQVTVGDTPLMLERKFVSLGRWWVGVSGSMTTLNLLDELERAGYCPDSPSALWEVIRERMDRAGYSTSTERDGGPKGYDQAFIAADGDGVWDINGRGSIVRVPDGKVWARGGGGDYAIGAGLAYREMDVAPRTVIEKAVRAAVDSDICCGGTPWLHHIRPEQGGC